MNSYNCINPVNISNTNITNASFDGKPHVPVYYLESSYTSNSKCINGHTWTYAASVGYDLEGTTCDCGQKIYHMERCKHCNSLIPAHYDVNNITK